MSKYKGLIQIHPRLARHIGDAITGEPCAWYYDHNKIGLLPVADDIYGVKVYHSKVTNDITDLPAQYRVYAVLFGLCRGLIKDGKYASANAVLTAYQNNLLFHRQDLYERDPDTEDKFKVPDSLLERQSIK